MNRNIIFVLVVFGAAVAVPRVKSQLYYLPDGAELIVGAIKTSFRCDGLSYGYYADIDNGCKIFHVCHPVRHEDGSEEMQEYSFYCGNQTVFDQGSLVCSHPENAVKCEDARKYYSVNENFGKDLPFLTKRS